MAQTNDDLELEMWMHIQGGDFARAYAVLTRLITIVEAPLMRGRLEAALGVLLQRSGLTADARESFRRGLDAVGDQPAERAFILAIGSMASALAGDLAAAEAEATEAIRLGRELGAAFVVGQAHVTLTIVHLGHSRPHQALAAAEEAVATEADGPGEAEYLSTAHVMKGMALAELDRFPEAYAAIGTGTAIAGGAADTGQVAWFAASEALLHLVDGTWTQARESATAALEHAERTGAHVAAGLAAGVAACIEANRGNVVVARELIERGASSRPGQFGGLGGEWLALATAAVATDPAERFAALCDAWFRLRGVPYQLAWKVAAHPLLVEALDAGDRALAEAVERTVRVGAERAGDVPSAQAVALCCRGSLDGSREVLGQGLELLRTAGRPFALAFACREAGRLAFADGDDAAGVAHLEEAGGIFHALGATTWGASVARLLVASTQDPPEQPARPGWELLTGAEERAARLMVGGLTNREIAERLGVSPRTIQTQLASASKRLGVHSRVQLASLLGATGDS